jgi:hypothetical protein
MESFKSVNRLKNLYRIKEKHLWIMMMMMMGTYGVE